MDRVLARSRCGAELPTQTAPNIGSALHRQLAAILYAALERLNLPPCDLPPEFFRHPLP